MMKQFRGRHKDLEKGDDIRNPQHLIQQKEKRLTQRMKNMSKDQRRSNGSNRPDEKYIGGGRSYSQKTKNKIVAGMRPTRSKQIVKTAGRDGNGFKAKRGGRGRGGKR